MPPATPVFGESRRERTPGGKLLFAVLIGFLLAIPLFSIYLLNYDRQSQSDTASQSIVSGWGGPQTIAGPVLVIPYQAQATETVEEGGKQVVKTSTVWKELVLSPEVSTIATDIKPERRKRSIYEAVVYETNLKGQARFVMPGDLERIGVPASALVFARAELRFGLSDARGLFGNPPVVTIAGKTLKLEPGHGLGATSRSGFFTWLDASGLTSAPIVADFDYNFRGNASLTLAPRAGDTTWTVSSTWPNPSFIGGFLPTTRSVTPKGFTATYRVGNLALGQSLVNADDSVVSAPLDGKMAASSYAGDGSAATGAATVGLIQPVDLYSQVNRATKYGFLFIGFTFVAFLMFDVIGGVRVSAVEYLLVGAGLVLFFVLLLAFAEVIGFTFAYLAASAAIIGLITAYSAAVLKSWKRASFIGGLLTALYGVLYILLSLEAYSLLIGSLLIFAALAGVMYATRNLDWGAKRDEAEAT
jgi:inner membrane protein